MISQEIKLLSLCVENFRCLENLSIDFQSTSIYQDDVTTLQEQGGGLTVIVAKNGEGKTALLDAINIGWGTFVSKMPDAKSQGFKKTDIRTIKNTAGQIIETGKPAVTLKVLINGKEHSVSRTLTDSEKKPVTTTRESRALTEFAEEILLICNEKSVETTLPVLAYYGDNRIFADNVLTQGHVAAMLNRSRKFGYADSTNPKSGYKEFLKWYSHLQKTIADAKLRQEEAKTQGNKQGQIEAWDDMNQLYYYNEVVTSAVKKALDVSGLNNLSYSVTDNKIYAWQTVDGKNDVSSRVPIENLSAGTKAVLGIVADLAYRCCTLNPHRQVMAAKDTPGIVLIDEIDLHLHPLWQQKVIPTLQSIFPNIQFIVTTHSPQVVSSVPSECVRIIKNGDVDSASGSEGADSARILEDIFGTSPFPKENRQRQKLKQYLDLVYAGKWNERKTLQLRSELDEVYCGKEPLLTDADLHIENEKWEAEHPDAADDVDNTSPNRQESKEE